MIILNKVLKGNSSIDRMNVVCAISRRGHCFEIGEISRKKKRCKSLEDVC